MELAIRNGGKQNSSNVVYTDDLNDLNYTRVGFAFDFDYIPTTRVGGVCAFERRRTHTVWSILTGIFDKLRNFTQTYPTVSP